MKITVVLLTAGILFTSGCQTVAPNLDISFWAGEPLKVGITRAQSNQTMACNDPKFDDYVCMSYEDLKKLLGMTFSCKQW